MRSEAKTDTDPAITNTINLLFGLSRVKDFDNRVREQFQLLAQRKITVDPNGFTPQLKDQLKTDPEGLESRQLQGRVLVVPGSITNLPIDEPGAERLIADLLFAAVTQAYPNQGEKEIEALTANIGKRLKGKAMGLVDAARIVK